MAKKNFYAVKAGRETGIFKTWEECLDKVYEYPNSKYKGFATVEEAKAYLNDSKIKHEVNEDFIQAIYESDDDDKIYYVVKKGRKIGLFNSWDECKEQIEGYSRAEHKKIIGKLAALKYLNPDIKIKKQKSQNKKSKLMNIHANKLVKLGYDVKPLQSIANVKKSNNFINPDDIREEYEFIAFVDGSYNKYAKMYGSGVIVVNDNKTYSVYSKTGYDEWSQWNIVGELEATKLAIEIAKKDGAKNVAIYHDLKSISLWATGEWKAKNRYTQDYVKFIEEASKELNIYFIKVKAHSGECMFNDLVDRVAKDAIAINNPMMKFGVIPILIE